LGRQLERNNLTRITDDTHCGKVNYAASVLNVWESWPKEKQSPIYFIKVMHTALDFLQSTKPKHY